MNQKLLVLPQAESDLETAFYWYESQKTGLGVYFIQHVENGISRIQKNPLLYPVEYRQTRKHLIKRFPFKIFYMIDNDTIIILAVLHSKRDISLAKKRINEHTPE